MLLIRRVKQPTVSEFNHPDRSHKLGRADETLRHSGYCCWLSAGFQKRSHKKVKINSCLTTLEYSYKSILPSRPVLKDLTSWSSRNFLEDGLVEGPRCFRLQEGWLQSLPLLAAVWWMMHLCGGCRGRPFSSRPGEQVRGMNSISPSQCTHSGVVSPESSAGWPSSLKFYEPRWLREKKNFPANGGEQQGRRGVTETDGWTDKAEIAAAHQKTLVPQKNWREGEQVCGGGAEKDLNKRREGGRMVAEDSGCQDWRWDGVSAHFSSCHHAICVYSVLLYKQLHGHNGSDLFLGSCICSSGCKAAALAAVFDSYSMRETAVGVSHCAGLNLEPRRLQTIVNTKSSSVSLCNAFSNHLMCILSCHNHKIFGGLYVAHNYEFKGNLCIVSNGQYLVEPTDAITAVRPLGNVSTPFTHL